MDQNFRHCNQTSRLDISFLSERFVSTNDPLVNTRQGVTKSKYSCYRRQDQSLPLSVDNETGLTETFWARSDCKKCEV